jgi:hypothetical protein
MIHHMLTSDMVCVDSWYITVVLIAPDYRNRSSNGKMKAPTCLVLPPLLLLFNIAATDKLNAGDNPKILGDQINMGFETMTFLKVDRYGSMVGTDLRHTIVHVVFWFTRC